MILAFLGNFRYRFWPFWIVVFEEFKLSLTIHEQTTLRPAPSTVWTVLDEAAVKPHKQTMWLNSRDPDFAIKQRVVTTLYREIPMVGRVILSLATTNGVLLLP